MMSLMKWVGVSLVAVLVGGAAGAQVTVGPGNQTGQPGQQVEFAFGYTGTNVSAFGFNIIYDAATAPYEPVLMAGTTDQIDCARDTGEPLPNIDLPPLVFVLSGKIAVSLGDLTFPIAAIGRDGVVARCKFQIKSSAAPGTYPLVCDTAPGQTTAADPVGNELQVTCQDGQLLIPTVPPTSTITPTPPVPTATSTATITNTPLPTNTRPPGGGDEDDGCQIGAPGSSGSAWMLFVPAALLVWLRRRVK
jgi:hypothetical protein